MPPPDEGAPALRLEGVRRSFRSGNRAVAAIDGVTASAARGAVTGLIGPDGAGKTTLMRLIAGLLLPDAGTIEALGIDVARDPLAVQARIGYMPQRFGLYEDLSVRQNLDLYADLQGVPAGDRPARYAELMRMTALGPFTERRAGTAVGRHEAEARPRLHPGASARTAAARRADRRRRSGFAARVVADHRPPDARRQSDGAVQHRLSRRGRALRRRPADPRRPAARQRAARRLHR